MLKKLNTKIIIATIFLVAFFLPYNLIARILFVASCILLFALCKIIIDVYKSILHSQKHFEAMQRKKEAANREKIIEMCNYIYNNL